MGRPDVCDLVLDACDLLERARGRAGDAALLSGEAELLRAELRAAVDGCDDTAVVADGLAAIAELDALLDLLDDAPRPLLALSA